MTITIPVYRPSLMGNEKKYVNDCLDSTWISSKGEYVARFETSIRDYVGVKYAASVCNGTVALHLALVALGIGPGDEVIVPTLTYIASVNAIAYCGAKPVFVDSRQQDWQMDPEQVRAKITANTRAIMAVHLYGHPCDIIALREIADERDLFIVEDCAEALGSRVGGVHVGTLADVSTFSFFGNKTVTTGEGGMVCTSDQTLHNRMTHLKSQGLASHRQYWHDIIGYNYRMTNICAAIGLAQMERAEEILTRKRVVATTYDELLQGLPVVRHQETAGTTHSFWMYSILVEDERHRDPLMKSLLNAGIETRPVFFPIHTMNMYSSKYARLPVAESVASRGINLPSWPDLTRAQIGEVCDAIRIFFDGMRIYI